MPKRRVTDVRAEALILQQEENEVREWLGVFRDATQHNRVAVMVDLLLKAQSDKISMDVMRKVVHRGHLFDVLQDARIRLIRMGKATNPRRLSSTLTPAQFRRWLKELSPLQRERLKEKAQMHLMAHRFLGRAYSKPLLTEVMKNPKGLYQDFHGNNPARVRNVHLPEPIGGRVIAIGRLMRLEYEPYPPSKHAGTRFYHVMGDDGNRILKDKPILATDGRSLFIVPDKASPRFTGRGIIG